MQLVLSNNRVIAHGGSYMAFDGVVINTETGERYERATVAECDSCPSDIDTVGYEYHAGTFVPCAPYGIGDGNVAVACNKDCKAIKDSGVPFGRMAQIVTTTYEGTGGTTVSLTFDAVPVMLFIRGYKSGGYYDSGYAMPGVYFNSSGIHTTYAEDTPGNDDYIRVEGKTFIMHESGYQDPAPFNNDGYIYTVTAILQGGE